CSWRRTRLTLFGPPRRNAEPPPSGRTRRPPGVRTVVRRRSGRHGGEFAEVAALLGEGVDVDAGAPGDEAHGGADLAGAVEAEGAVEDAVAVVEGAERGGVGVAAVDDLVAGGDVPGQLQAEVELVGPEPGDLGVRLGGPRHRAARGDALVLRVLPVLEPDAAAEVGVGGVRHVARGVHVLERGAAVLVDEDAVAGGDAGLGGDREVGLDADADDDAGGLDAGAVGGHDRADPVVALDAVDADAEAQVDAAFAVVA